MQTISMTAALAAILSMCASGTAFAEPVFNRIAAFAVAANLPEGVAQTSVTSAEIVTAMEDGKTLVYSDSPLKAIGFIDITTAAAPRAAGLVPFDGEPTS